MSKECLFCGKETMNPKYCRQKCDSDHRWQKRKEKIEKFGSEKSPKVAKKYILEKRGHKCEICGLIEWRGKTVPLVLDHINGNPEDNRETNLRLVCGNCDMQLPTYKSKNRGNGRFSRKKRMREGKSY